MIGSVLELPTDHPGVSDPVYVARRNHLANLSANLELRCPPTARRLTRRSRTMSGRRSRCAHCTACTDYASGQYQPAAAVSICRTDRVPQLADVSDRLTDLTGWRLCAVPGLVSTAEFFSALADRCFPSSAVRAPRVGALLHAEPDVIHELIGHANSLASPRIAGLYERAGQVARPAHGPAPRRGARQRCSGSPSNSALPGSRCAAHLRGRLAELVRVRSPTSATPTCDRSTPAAMGGVHRLTRSRPSKSVLFAAESFDDAEAR